MSLSLRNVEKLQSSEAVKCHVNECNYQLSLFEIILSSPHHNCHYIITVYALAFILKEVYSAEENYQAFDSVVTCFFIDTAHNIVEYVEIINHCLKPGGYWINLGPLLYHW
jgi:hypothetical protein